MLNPRHSREPGLYRSLCAGNSRPGTRCAIQGHRTAMSKITNEFSEFVLFSEDENRCLDERRIERDVRGKLLPYRSEEHTSELQSIMRISYAVFCLKKKKITYQHTNTHT